VRKHAAQSHCPPTSSAGAAASSSEPEPESLSLCALRLLSLAAALAGAAAPFLATLVWTSLALESLSEEDMVAEVE